MRLCRLILNFVFGTSSLRKLERSKLEMQIHQNGFEDVNEIFGDKLSAIQKV